MAMEEGASPRASESLNNGASYKLGNGFHKADEDNSSVAQVVTLEETGDESDNGEVRPAGEEENALNLALKLKIALKEIITKDNLVKQHAKVAEDAISGWEKAEAEAAALKLQLDSAVQQKLALEERTAHLDGALKECVKQLRNGREEQEQKQEEIAKQAEEWENLRINLEAKLEEAEAAALDNAAKADALEQRISSLTDAKGQAELESKKVSSKVEALEKENMNLKHDVRVVKKDLVNLNNESKKAAEGAKQQLADSARKVLKLEADCQKLKTQLRKRSTGSAARIEGDVLDRRKSLGRLVSSPRAFSVESVDDCSEMSTREMDEKWFTMEEETKALKDEMQKRDREMQAARIMCARTACKFFSVEEQLEAQNISKSFLAGLGAYIENLKAFGSNQEFSVGPTTEGGDEADVWAIALVDELAQFKKEDKKPDKLLDTTSFELMDDFLEMEKLTFNLPQENGGVDKREALSDFARKEKELEAANERVMVLSKKVAGLEARLNAQVDVPPCSNGDSQPDAIVKPEASLICGIIRTLELIADNAGLTHEQESLDSGKEIQESLIAPGFQWEDVNVNAAFEELASSGNALVQGKADYATFSEKVSSLLKIVRSFQARDVPGLSNELEAKVENLKNENVRLGHQLSVCQAALTSLEADKLALENTFNDRVAKAASERDQLKLQNQDMEEQLAGRNSIIEQLRSTIAVLEEDVNAADERAHSTVKGLTTTFEEDIGRAKHERETAQKSIEAMNVVMAELQAQKSVLDEDAKSLVNKLAKLEEELKRERLDKLAAKKDIDAVNQDIQKLMAEFIQLQHEKQNLEVALSEDQQQREAAYLKDVAQLEERLRRSVQQDESKTLVRDIRSELERFVQREEALQKSMSEKDAKHIEMLVRIEKLKEEKTQMTGIIEDLEQKLAGVGELLRIEQGRVNALKDENGRLELQNVRFEGELSDSEEKLKEQQASFRSLQDEFYQMKIEKEDTEQTYLMAEQNVQQLQTRLASLDEECAKLKAENASIQNGLTLDVQRVRGEYDRSDRELKAVSTEKDRLCSELEELASIVRETKAECTRKENELSALKACNDELEQKLNAAAVDVRNARTECTELETESRDLEHVLSATNEIVQGLREECSRLSDVEGRLTVEKQRLEKELAAAEGKLKSVCEELKNVEGDKAELEHDLALSQVTWKSQVFEADELVASLRAELALSAKSKQLVEEQLAESFSAKAELQYQVKAAVHEASQEADRAKSLEEELQNERAKSQSSIDELRQQLSRTRDNDVMSEASQSSPEKRGIDLSAKLDECHRAILTLGEQLQSLSLPRNSNPPSPTEPSTAASEESISTLKAEAEETEKAKGVENDGDVSMEGKVFVPSLPLEGRPRSKSTSPAKSKSSKSSSSASKELDFSKSVDMSSSPSEKPSSSGFSRFFRGKSSNHH